MDYPKTDYGEILRTTCDYCGEDGKSLNDVYESPNNPNCPLQGRVCDDCWEEAEGEDFEGLFKEEEPLEYGVDE